MGDVCRVRGPLRDDIEGVAWTEVLARDVHGTSARLGPGLQRLVLWELDWSGRLEP